MEKTSTSSTITKVALIAFILVLALGSVYEFASNYDQTHNTVFASIAAVVFFLLWGIVGSISYLVMRFFMGVMNEDGSANSAAATDEPAQIEVASNDTAKAKIAPQHLQESDDAKRKQQADFQDKLDEILSWTRVTFESVLTPSDMEILLNNITLFAEGKDAKGEDAQIKVRLEGVTNTDLHHFGWSIGKRLGKTNSEIAFFLKATFAKMLENVEAQTIAAKLRNSDGRFTLHTQPLDEPLTAHVFPKLA